MILQDFAVGHVLPVPLHTVGSMLGYKTCLWNFAGGPVVKTLCSQCRGAGDMVQSGN